jgi:splicing factor 1
MSYRAQGTTGSNNIPLGNRRRFGNDDGNGDVKRDYDRGSNSRGPPGGGHDGGFKRGRSLERGVFMTSCRLNDTDLCQAPIPAAGPRKKRNRWGDASDNKAAGLMGLPTAIVSDMTSEQLEAYTLHLRIEEITQKLKIDDVVPGERGG